MPGLFLSCTSGEFGHLRDQLLADLRRPNVEVKAHDEIAGHNTAATTLEKLDDYLATCDAVVHLVGAGTGAAVEVAPSQLPQRHGKVFEGRDEVLAQIDADWADALAERPGRARVVSLVAIGGAGKTTVAVRWKNRLLERDGHGGVERYFDWSFYSQGTARC